jgi:ribosome-binding factor A
LVSELLRREIRPSGWGDYITAAKVSKTLVRESILTFSVVARIRKTCGGPGSATGFIRSKVGKQLNLGFVPTIEFLR